jgi:hypothetical protein
MGPTQSSAVQTAFILTKTLANVIFRNLLNVPLIPMNVANVDISLLETMIPVLPLIFISHHQRSSMREVTTVSRRLNPATMDSFGTTEMKNATCQVMSWVVSNINSCFESFLIILLNNVVDWFKK